MPTAVRRTASTSTPRRPPTCPSGALRGLPVDPVFFTGGLALVLEPMAATVLEHLVGVDDETMVVIDVNARPAVIADRARYLTNLAVAVGRADVVKASDEDLAFLGDDCRSTISSPPACGRSS